MNLNKKSLLVACVLAAMSTTAFAATESTSSTTVTNHDTPTSTSTRVTREQHSTSTSSATVSSTEKTSTKSSGASVSVGLGRLGDYVAAPIISPQQKAPEAIKALQNVVANDGYIKLGQLAMVKQSGKWGLVGTDGKVLLEAQFKEMESSISADGTFFVRRKKELEHIKGDGTAVAANSEEAYQHYKTDKYTRKAIADAALDGNVQKDNTEYASSSYTSFSVKSKWGGFNDASGKTVIEPQFKEVYTGFSEDRAFVKNAKGKTVAIDGSGNTVFEAPTNDIDPYKNGLAEYRRHISKFNFGGLLGLAVGIGLSNHGGFYYGDAWNPVYDGVKRGYLDRNGNIVIDSKNDAVWPMTEHGTLVKNEGKLGL